MKTKINPVVSTMMILLTGMLATNASGKTITETRTVETFSGIDLRSVANVYVTQGETQQIIIETEENQLHYITTKVKNEELIIDIDEHVELHGNVNVYITVKELCLLELTGSGNIITKNEIQCDHMSLRLSGSGDMHVTLKSLLLKTTLSGSGNLVLNGSSPESTIKISGSGNVDAQLLKTFISSVTISGSGNSKIDANNELTVNITGSGNVYFVAEPAKINSKITGSGEVEKI